MTKYSKVTNYEYLHGDFDRDRVPNIDDKHPFRKQKNDWVNREASLSKAFKHLDSERNRAEAIAKPYAKKHGFTSFRVKDNYSVVNKLITKKINTLGDYIGFRRETRYRDEARARWVLFNRGKANIIEDKENKYASKKAFPYGAYHTNLWVGGKDKGFVAEAQFRTRKHGKLNDLMHFDYKTGSNNKAYYRKTARKLRARGY